MDALVPAFIAVILSEMGGKVQKGAHAYGMQGGKGGVFAALMLSSAVYYAISVIAGMIISTYITPNPKTLLLAMALVFAGVPMALRAKPVAATKGGFAGSVNYFVTKQFGDASAFILLAIVARTNMPGLALAGGLAGVAVAAAAPLMMGRDWPQDMPVTLLRWIAAVLLTLVGVRLALIALQII
jgi:putative Ca2+/H+ antiporter (TMEM165/GDT1 family)